MFGGAAVRLGSLARAGRRAVSRLVTKRFTKTSIPIPLPRFRPGCVTRHGDCIHIHRRPSRVDERAPRAAAGALCYQVVCPSTLPLSHLPFLQLFFQAKMARTKQVHRGDQYMLSPRSAPILKSDEDEDVETRSKRQKLVGGEEAERGWGAMMLRGRGVATVSGDR